MPTCPRSLLFLLPTPLWHRFISSFFSSSFCWQKLSDSYDCFHTGRWLVREILQLRLKTKLNPKPPPIFSVLIHFFVLLFFPSFKKFFFTHNNRRFVSQPVFANQAFPFSFSLIFFLPFLLSRHVARTAHRFQHAFEDKRRQFAASLLLLSTGSLSTLHIINEAEVRCQVKVCSCDLKLCQECCGSHSVHIQSMT